MADTDQAVAKLTKSIGVMEKRIRILETASKKHDKTITSHELYWKNYQKTFRSLLSEIDRVWKAINK